MKGLSEKVCFRNGTWVIFSDVVKNDYILEYKNLGFMNVVLAERNN